MPRISAPARDPMPTSSVGRAAAGGAARHQPDALFRGQIVELPELEDEGPLTGGGDMPAVLEWPK